MTGFTAVPSVDQPAGFELVLSDADFASATQGEQVTALEALVTSDNPLLHTAETVQCAACHVSTPLLDGRAATAGVDPLSLDGRYEAAGFDLSPTMEDGRTLRLLGWLGDEVRIGRRVINESAQTVLEIDARF